MARKPISLETLQTEFLERVADTATKRAASAMSLLARAAEYIDSGDDNVKAKRVYAALTNYHEAARISLTALALVSGDRFLSVQRAHQAVIDYALANHHITHSEWQILEELRTTRNEIEYADDAIAPTDTDLTTVAMTARKLFKTAMDRAKNATSKAVQPKSSPKLAPGSGRTVRAPDGKPIPPPPS